MNAGIGRRWPAFLASIVDQTSEAGNRTTSPLEAGNERAGGLHPTLAVASRPAPGAGELSQARRQAFPFRREPSRIEPEKPEAPNPAHGGYRAPAIRGFLIDPRED